VHIDNVPTDDAEARQHTGIAHLAGHFLALKRVKPQDGDCPPWRRSFA
jgi:hypothetical protein